MLGPKITDEFYRLIGRQETEKVSNLYHDIKKRRLKMGHMKRMNDAQTG